MKFAINRVRFARVSPRVCSPLKKKKRKQIESDKHPIVECDTVDATVSKRSVSPKCVTKSFDPDTACDTSVYDMQVSQQFQDCITTDQPTTQAVSISQKRMTGLKN